MSNLDNRIFNAEELTKLATLVLSSLDKVHSLDSIKETITLLDSSPITWMRVIFEDAISFHKEEGRFPDAVYLEAKHPNKFYDPEMPYSPDIFIQLTNQLKKHKQLKQIMEAINNQDLDAVQDIVSGNIKCRNKNPITIDSVISGYAAAKLAPKGLKFGIPDLDRYTKGLDYGTLNVVAAPVGRFKTTFALSIAYRAAVKEGKKVLYITLEVTTMRIFYNLIARHAHEIGYDIKASHIKKTILTPKQEIQLEKAVKDWKSNAKGQITVVGSEDLEECTPAYLEAFIQKKKEEMGGELDLVVIDYINLFKNRIPPSLKLDQYSALNHYIQFFTDLSIRMNFILLMLCQVSRAGTELLEKQGEQDGGKKLASTTYFAEANEIERSASVALILYASKAQKNAGNVDIFIVKNRDGDTPENPINTIVLPEYFSVGVAKSQFPEMGNPEAMAELITNPASSKTTEEIMEEEQDAENVDEEYDMDFGSMDFED